MTEKDIVPRVTDDWTIFGTAAAMVRALEARETDVPAWFRLLHDELASSRRGLRTAIFGMT
ncbi:MAG: hypothetical protein AB7I19_13085 [Planctomycetota bacterium]